MTLPKSTHQRESEKFVEDADGNVAVRTQVGSGDIQIGAVEIKDHDGTDRATVTASNEVKVIETSAADIKSNTDNIPSDPSTEAKQDDIITELQTTNGKFPFEDYQYMGSQTSGDYVYYGFKRYGGTGWYIMRKDTTDDSAWAYAYSSVGGNSWTTAWGTPGSESFDDPPDS